MREVGEGRHCPLVARSAIFSKESISRAAQDSQCQGKIIAGRRLIILLECFFFKSFLLIEEVVDGYHSNPDGTAHSYSFAGIRIYPSFSTFFFLIDLLIFFFPKQLSHKLHRPNIGMYFGSINLTSESLTTCHPE